MHSSAEQIFQDMKNNLKKKRFFVGDKNTADYLGYVLGQNLTFECISSSDYRDDAFYVIDDITSNNIKAPEMYGAILLSDFVLVLNKSVIPENRDIALWGGGYELVNEFDIIKEYCSPKYIIDRSKTGSYRGVAYIHPDDIDIRKFFIIITTTKFASEIRSILEENGCKEGIDYILGSNPYNLNDNASMFLETLTDYPIKKLNCRRPFEYVNVGVGGNITHCCFDWLPKYVGNILEDNCGYDSITSRIIRVSFMNCTYSFCNSICCPEMANERKNLLTEDRVCVDESVYMKKQNIKDVDVAFDNTCNLYCESCRNDFLVDKTKEPLIIAENIKKKLLPIAKRMTIAGNGEVFLSKAYQSLFDCNAPDLNMIILSNGNLFTNEKWMLLDGKYKSVHLTFSVDAASKKTYEKVRRGGKWENLLRGLETASKLRKEGKIERFVIRFVVSSQNYIEMPQFVELGVGMGCDCVNFTRIENWGTFSDEEFTEMSMFVGNEPKPDLRQLLQMPIMHNPIISYSNITII